MSSRNRNRIGVSQSVGYEPEEQLHWDNIEASLRTLASIQKRQLEVKEQALELEKKINERAKDDTAGANVGEIDALSDYVRQYLKLVAEEKRMLDEEPHDILRNLNVLKALRDASSNGPVLSSSSSKARKPKPGVAAGKSDLDTSADLASAINLSGSAGRLKGSASVRSGSVASTRDGRDRDVDMKDAGETKGATAERAGKLKVGAEVAYKQAKAKDDGSQWIQCIILQVLENGNKRRYEVQDPEPDDNGAPGEKFRASASQLIAIPTIDVVLPDYPVGKQVLAQYPQTTTFYRAEVTGTKKTKDGSVCRLKFEDDANIELEVPRRYVLEVGGR